MAKQLIVLMFWFSKYSILISNLDVKMMTVLTSLLQIFPCHADKKRKKKTSQDFIHSLKVRFFAHIMPFIDFFSVMKLYNK